MLYIYLLSVGVHYSPTVQCTKEKEVLLTLGNDIADGGETATERFMTISASN